MITLSRKLFPELQTYFHKIDNAFRIRYEDSTIYLEYFQELDEELSNTLGDETTYKTRSPFEIHFQTELNNCRRIITELKHVWKENIYFLPNLPNFLTTYYMAICPLWFGLILGPKLYPINSAITYTNAIAGNWMSIVKLTILYNKSNLTAGDFIRKLREGIIGRVEAFKFAFEPISVKIIKREKTKKLKADDEMEEVWRKGRKKRSYFRPGRGILKYSSHELTKSISTISKSKPKSKTSNKNSQMMLESKNIPNQSTDNHSRVLLREISTPVRFLYPCIR